ncbi:MAG: hypothetical protein ACR2KK_20545 [Acidimicrobiales bacterium]
MDPAGLRPLGVGEVLDVAIKIYRARFGVLVKSVAVILGPVFALAAVIRVSIPPGDDLLEPPIDPSAPPEFDIEQLLPFIAGTLLIALLAFVASQVATGACFKAVSGAYLDEEPNWRESLRFARSRLGSLLWLSFLLVILLVPAVLACIVPGIYLWVAWSVAAPVLLLEDRKGWSALKRSQELVQGRFWPTVAILLLVALLTGMVQLIFLGVLAGLVSVTGNEVAAALADAIGQTASSALTTPLSAAVLTVLYFDLRVRKEGFDLELLAHRLGVEPGTVGGADFMPAPPPSAPSDDQPPFWPPPPGWRPRDG